MVLLTFQTIFYVLTYQPSEEIPIKHQFTQVFEKSDTACCSQLSRT